MTVTPLIEVFESIAVVLLRNGALPSDLYGALRTAEAQVEHEREKNKRDEGGNER